MFIKLSSLIQIYKRHPSIKAIITHSEKINKHNCSFNEITKSKIVKELKSLNPRKTLQSNDIYTKLKFCAMLETIIVKDFNDCLNTGTFPESFKISELIPVFLKNERTDDP